MYKFSDAKFFRPLFTLGLSACNKTIEPRTSQAAVKPKKKMTSSIIITCSLKGLIVIYLSLIKN